MSFLRPDVLVDKTVVLISGSRGIRSYWLFAQLLSKYLKDFDIKNTVLLQGEAFFGVDRLARIWAKRNKWPCVGWPADWDGLGRRAGHVRNAQMLTHSESVFVVWDGKSPGSNNTISVAQRRKLPLVIERLVKYDDADARNMTSTLRYRRLGDKAVSKVKIKATL